MRRAEQVALQLRALLERHGLSPSDIEKRSTAEGRTPVAAITVRRILKGQPRTEPEPLTLRRIAEAAGESYFAAFAETPEVIAPTPTSQAPRFFLRFIGTPPPEGLEADLRKLLDRYEKSPGRK
jgi:transcriptional regulator with XRE-family HTH domain